MANKRITELTDIGTPASADVLEIVDVSDTTDSPEGTSKKVQVSALGGAVDSVNSQTGVVSIDLESVLTEGGTATDLSITLDTVISDTAIILDPSGENISITDTVTNETLSLYKERLLKSKGGFSTELAFTDPTANRVVTVQDDDGTLAFLSDIPTLDVNTLGAVVNGASSATPNDTDLVLSVESSVAKKNTWTQIKAFLKTYFDTLYATLTTATSSVAGIVKLYTSTGNSTDGTMDRNSITNALATKVTFWGSAVDGVTVANTLTIEPAYSQLIPANTFSAGNTIVLNFRATSPGAKTSASSLYFYVNTSNNLSGATQLAIYTGNATSRTIQADRNLSVKGATTKTINPATPVSTDTGPSAAMTAHTIDWTVDQYILFAIGHTVADQTLTGDFYTIEKK